MKNRIATRSTPTWLGFCSLALAMSCGGAQTPPPNNNPPPQGEQHAAEQAPDLSEVALPERAVLVARVASPTQLAERAAQLTGQSQLRAQIAQLYAAAFGQAADSVVDRNAALDVMVVSDPDSDLKIVMSIPGNSMEEVQTALASGHRFVPAGNGVMRIEASASAPRPSGEFGEDSSGGSDELANCVIAPTPNQGSTRIVCAENETARAVAVPFLSRTLPRRETTPNAITVDAVMDNLRNLYFAEWRQQLAREREEFDQNAATEFRDAAVRAVVVNLAHTLFDTGRLALDDAAAFNMTLTLSDDRAVLHTQFDTHGPSAPLLHMLAAGFNNQQAVPAEMTNHLLPDAWLYAAASADSRVFGPLLDELREGVNAAVNARASLAPADRAAISTALDGLRTLDQGMAVEQIGHDAQGHPWVATMTRNATTPAAQYVTAMRNIVTALRRPAVAAIARRALDKLKLAPGEIGALPDLPARGLPAGAYGFSFPLALAMPRPPEAESPTSTGSASQGQTPTHGHGGAGHGAAAGAGPTRARGGHHGGAAAAAGPMMQVLIVPSGQDVYVVMGTDARALYTRFSSNTTPGIDPAAIAVPGGGVAFAPVLAGFVNLMRAAPNANQDSIHEFEQMLAQLPDHGTTPITLRGGVSTVAGDLTRFSSDIDVPRQALQDYTALLTQSVAHMAAPPPPTPRATAPSP